MKSLEGLGAAAVVALVQFLIMNDVENAEYSP
jgi:hypothetical protein